MAMTVQTNMGAVTALKHLTTSQNTMNSHLERLSSGYRINSAADDAAGYAIASKMDANKGKLVAAQENAFAAQAMVKMADAALNEVTNITKRLQVLATKAASGQNSTAEQANLDKEAQKLLDVMDKIVETTKFNGNVLLGGSYAATGKTIQIGTSGGSNDRIEVKFADSHASALGVTYASAAAVGTGTAGKVSLVSAADAQKSLTQLDAALTALADTRASLGASSNQLGYIAANLGTSIEQTSNTLSAVKDTDMALEMSEFTKSKIMVQAGTAMVSQANISSQDVMNLFR